MIGTSSLAKMSLAEMSLAEISLAEISLAEMSLREMEPGEMLRNVHFETSNTHFTTIHLLNQHAGRSVESSSQQRDVS